MTFRYECHTGVDAGRGFVHRVEATATYAYDIIVVAKLLQENDEAIYGNSAYLEIEKRDEIKQEEHLSAIEYQHTSNPNRRFYTSGELLNILWPDSTIPAVFPKIMRYLSVVPKLFVLLLLFALC